jgi:hypothetical protein
MHHNEFVLGITSMSSRCENVEANHQLSVKRYFDWAYRLLVDYSQKWCQTMVPSHLGSTELEPMQEFVLPMSSLLIFLDVCMYIVLTNKSYISEGLLELSFLVIVMACYL